MRFVSWFAGIGGCDLGLMRAGHTPVAYSEIDPYAIKVYEQHFPGVPNLGDINKVQPRDIPEADLWTGGIPCQPFSVAGKRRGEADERNLWPPFYRLIRQVRPSHILVENVPGLLADPYILTILGQLAESGYDAEWSVISDRIAALETTEHLYIMAWRDGLGRQEGIGLHRLATRPGCWEQEGFMEGVAVVGGGDGRRFRAVPHTGVYRMAATVPSGLDRLRCLGNAVVPQVVQWIGERLNDPGS